MSGSAGYLYRVDEIIPGTKLRVRMCLGRGGMGSVYEVSAPPKGERYVIKVVHPHLLKAPRIRERLRKEAILLTEFEHPNIVQVFFTGETADDPPLPYYVMERLHGCALTDVLQALAGRGLPLALTFEILVELMSALAYAHDRGVVHRDVKLDNLFLHYDPSGARVAKLLDFGIVRVLSETRATMAGFVGTLGNAAPEQLRNEDPSPACDIYSAGVTLYQMITGRDPFGELLDPQLIVRAHLFTAPTPASAHRLLPPELDALVLAMLAKEPRDRPCARDVGTALQQIASALAGDGRFDSAEANQLWADADGRLRRDAKLAATTPALSSSHHAADAAGSYPKFGGSGSHPVAPPTLPGAGVDRARAGGSSISAGSSGGTGGGGTGGGGTGAGTSGSGGTGGARRSSLPPPSANAPIEVDDDDYGPAGTVRLAVVNTTSAKTSFTMQPRQPSAAEEGDAPSEPASSRRGLRRPGWVLAGSAVVFALVVFGAWWSFFGRAPAPTADAPGDAIPPPDRSGASTPSKVSSSSSPSGDSLPNGHANEVSPQKPNAGPPAEGPGNEPQPDSIASAPPMRGALPAGERAAPGGPGARPTTPGSNLANNTPGPTGKGAAAKPKGAAAAKRPPTASGAPKEGTGPLVAPDWGSLAPGAGNLSP